MFTDGADTKENNLDPDPTPQILLTWIRILTRLKNWQQKNELYSKKLDLFHSKIFITKKTMTKPVIVYRYFYDFRLVGTVVQLPVIGREPVHTRTNDE